MQGGGQCSRDAEAGSEYCWQHPLGASPRSVSDAQIVAALEKSHGLVRLAAEHLGVSHTVIDERKKSSRDVAKVLDAQRGLREDEARAKLEDGVKNGEAWAIRFTLLQAEERDSALSALSRLGDESDMVDGAAVEDALTMLSETRDDGEE